MEVTRSLTIVGPSKLKPGSCVRLVPPPQHDMNIQGHIGLDGQAHNIELGGGHTGVGL